MADSSDDCASLPATAAVAAAAAAMVQAGTPPPTKRKRADLTPKIKKEICLYKESNPTLTQNSVCLYAENALGVRIGRSTVCDILKDKEKWIALGDVAMSTRIRRPKHEELENALSAWYAEVTSQEGVTTVSDDLLRDQAKLLGRQLGIEDFQYSNGWLSRFKARRGLHLARMERAGGLPRPDDFRKEVNSLLGAHSPENVYYCEAVDVAYRLEWHVGGWRDSLALLLCTNITGSDKRTPLVIWRHPRARCFGPAFDPNALVQWRHSEEVALTPALFSDWLAALDAECQASGRRVLLMCNVPPDLLGHVGVANVSLCLLGHSFEGVGGHFRALVGLEQLTRLLEQLEEGQEPSTDVKEALYCLRDAWAEMRVDVLLLRLYNLGLSVSQPPRGDRGQVEDKFASVLGHSADEPTSTVPAGHAAGLDAAEGFDDSEAPEAVSAEEARKAVDRLMAFMEQHMGDGAAQFSIADLDALRGARRRCLALRREEARKEKMVQFSMAQAEVKVEFTEVIAPM